MNVHALSQARQRWLAIAVLALALAAGFVLIAQPVAHAFAAQQDRIDSAQRDLARWQGVIASESEIIAAAAVISRDARLERGTLMATSSTQAAAGLQSLVRKALIGAGADVRSSQILPADEHGNLRMAGVRVVVMATSEQFERSITAIDNSTPYLFVREADIELSSGSRRTGADAEEPVLQVRLDIYAFSRSQE